jgi:hypothetical protein
MSPDAPVDQHPADPQSWNLYSYVRNNPLILLDPSGNYSCNPTSMSQSQCDDFGSDLAKAKLDAATALSHEEISGDQYNAVTGALGAYGALNDGNGVTVNLGATGGLPGNTRTEGGGDKTTANPTGQNINVTLNGGLFDRGSSNELLETIAHEGSHVGDAEAWAKAGFTPKANPSRFNTEFAAYGVTIAMGQALGAKYLSGNLPGKNAGPMLFWDSIKTSAENTLMRSRMIQSLYPKSNLKAFGENTKGSGFGTK